MPVTEEEIKTATSTLDKVEYSSVLDKLREAKTNLENSIKQYALVNPADNEVLRKKYKVQPEYDYIDNSVYKTFLACDPVSDEILLHYHYRCHRKIIEFNNKKYYNGKLSVESNVESNTPLVFVDVKESGADIKNTAPEEAEQILQYVQKHPEQNVGIITPFTNQRELIESGLKKIGRKDVTCGTVHAFQGDEKDVILFSLGLSKITGVKTYDFLFPGNCIFPSVMLYCKYADANCKGVTESDENAALSVRLLFVIYGRGRRAAVLPCRSGRGDPVFVAGT
ncbi:MAG: hypothetical protein K6G90_13910 [Clostridia bacterium]|nr:hypothetical protein [Clostridia bacterium]